MGVQRREEAKAAIPEPHSAAEAVLSQRKIKTLVLSPYSSKTWREHPAKVLIPKDRPWEGVPPVPTSKHQAAEKAKNLSLLSNHQKIYFRGDVAMIVVAIE
jgi:hypothetical protein